MLCLTIHYWSRVALTLRGSTSEGDVTLYEEITNRLSEAKPNDVSMCVALTDKQIDRVEFVLQPHYSERSAT